jgi:hypothetical protein
VGGGVDVGCRGFAAASSSRGRRGAEEEFEPEELDLAGLQVTFQPAGEDSYILVTLQNGTICEPAVFPGHLHDHGDVIGFYVRIKNAISVDEEFRDHLRSQVTEIDNQIRQAETEAAKDLKTARDDLAELIKEQKTDLQWIQADTLWETERQTWQDRTGLRPVWWWRW